MPQRDIDKLTDDELFADWVNWVERIYDETVNQAWNYRMFRLVGGIFEQNPRLRETAGFVWDWMALNYVAGAAMTLRRELDRQGGTENLWRLLLELATRPRVISRARFRASWGSDDFWDADRAFESFRFVECPEDRTLDYIDPDAVGQDSARLEKETETVRQHIERTVAHRTPRRKGQEPITYSTFHAALAAIDDVFKKYYVLLTHKTIMATEPTAQFDEFEAFTFPWIANPATFDYGKCE